MKNKITTGCGEVATDSDFNFGYAIKSVSGAVRPGKLVAVMGGSGAGKTTLMSALAQRSSSEFQN